MMVPKDVAGSVARFMHSKAMDATSQQGMGAAADALDVRYLAAPFNDPVHIIKSEPAVRCLPGIDSDKEGLIADGIAAVGLQVSPERPSCGRARADGTALVSFADDGERPVSRPTSRMVGPHNPPARIPMTTSSRISATSRSGARVGLPMSASAWTRSLGTRGA